VAKGLPDRYLVAHHVPPSGNGADRLTRTQKAARHFCGGFVPGVIAAGAGSVARLLRPGRAEDWAQPHPLELVGRRCSFEGGTANPEAVQVMAQSFCRVWGWHRVSGWPGLLREGPAHQLRYPEKRKGGLDQEKPPLTPLDLSRRRLVWLYPNRRGPWVDGDYRLGTTPVLLERLATAGSFGAPRRSASRRGDSGRVLSRPEHSTSHIYRSKPCHDRLAVVVPTIFRLTAEDFGGNIPYGH